MPPMCALSRCANANWLVWRLPPSSRLNSTPLRDQGEAYAAVMQRAGGRHHALLAWADSWLHECMQGLLEAADAALDLAASAFAVFADEREAVWAYEPRTAALRESAPQLPDSSAQSG